MSDKLLFRELKKTDWESVSKIYQEGLDTGNATFELNLPDWNEWNSGHIKECRIIAEIDNEVVGWSALSPISSRCVYGGVAEVGVYVLSKFSGQKIGTKLLERLIVESENKGSIIIHERLGFRKVGYRVKIGKMNDVWRDTFLFEKRSERIGIQ